MRKKSVTKTPAASKPVVTHLENNSVRVTVSMLASVAELSCLDAKQRKAFMCGLAEVMEHIESQKAGE